MNTFLISNTNAKGPGFGMFSLTHILTLIGLAIVSALIIRYYKRASADKRPKIRVTIALTILALEVGKDIALALTGQFTLGDWPFQLCGIGIFIVLADAIRRGKTTQELLYSLTLPGAAMADLTPDWVTNHWANLFVWQSFTIHMLLVTYVLMSLIGKDFRPNWRQLWRVVIFLAILTPLCSWLNHAWQQNFMFLEIPVAGSPLAFVHTIFGNYYLLGMVLLVVVFWLLMYLPWGLVSRHKKRAN